MEKIKHDAKGKGHECELSFAHSPYNQADETEAENQPKCSPADILQGYSIIKRRPSYYELLR